MMAIMATKVAMAIMTTTIMGTINSNIKYDDGIMAIMMRMVIMPPPPFKANFLSFQFYTPTLAITSVNITGVNNKSEHTKRNQVSVSSN